MLSKTQLDRLGDRLKSGTSDEPDLRLLDEYRRSFRTAYETAASTIRQTLGVEATGREAKTTAAISAKLRRQSIRLTQIQDIAGLRVIVADLRSQDGLVSRLASLFPGALVEDRRKQPSNGYRAVHVIAVIGHRPVEIQVRTQEQHLWAELSERIADSVDSAIKYGGGPTGVRDLLGLLSQRLADIEAAEERAHEAGEALFDARHAFSVDTIANRPELAAELKKIEWDVDALWDEVEGWKRGLREVIQALQAIARIERDQP